MDHIQLQHVKGRPFILSSHTLTCFEMIMLQNSVIIYEDAPFQRLQDIARIYYKKYIDTREIISEFKHLISETCSFVENWSFPEIRPSTYRLYGKQFPANEVTNQFVTTVRSRIEINSLRERCADDVEKYRYSHSERSPAIFSTKNTLDIQVKQPSILLFFRGAVYDFTYNNEGKFSASQM